MPPDEHRHDKCPEKTFGPFPEPDRSPRNVLIETYGSPDHEWRQTHVAGVVHHLVSRFEINVPIPAGQRLPNGSPMGAMGQSAALGPAYPFAMPALAGVDPRLLLIAESFFRLWILPSRHLVLNTS